MRNAIGNIDAGDELGQHDEKHLRNVQFAFREKIDYRCPNFYYDVKKKTSSNLPFRIASGGIISILLAVATTKTGDTFSASQVKKVARTRFVVPLSPPIR